MANWDAKSFHVCLDSPLPWYTSVASADAKSKEHVSKYDLTFPVNSTADVDLSQCRVLFDNLHEEVILIRGNPATEFFMSDKQTKTWVRFPLYLPDNPNILDASLSFDKAYLSLRTSDKDVRIHDTTTGLMLESRSCRGTSASMLSLQWINHTPALTSATDPLSRTRSIIFPNATNIHEFNESLAASNSPVIDAASAIFTVPNSSTPSAFVAPNANNPDLPDSVNAAIPGTFLFRPMISESQGQFLLFITSVGLELHMMHHNQLRRIKTVAVSVADHWVVPAFNLVMVVSPELTFHMFSITVPSGVLSRICKFELDYTSSLPSPNAPPVPPGSVSHAVVTDGGCVGINAGLSGGGLVAGSGNITLGQDALISGGGATSPSNGNKNVGKNIPPQAIPHAYRFSLVVLHDKIHCALVDETAPRLFLLTLTGGVMSQTHMFDLYLPGRCVIGVLDNLLCVHNLTHGVVLLFDPSSKKDEPVAPPMPLAVGNTAKRHIAAVRAAVWITQVLNERAAKSDANAGTGSDDLENIPEIPVEFSISDSNTPLFSTWLCVGEKYIINATPDGTKGCFYILSLDLTRITLAWQQQRILRLLEFLSRRQSLLAKKLWLCAVRSVIEESTVQAVIRKSGVSIDISDEDEEKGELITQDVPLSPLPLSPTVPNPSFDDERSHQSTGFSVAASAQRTTNTATDAKTSQGLSQSVALSVISKAFGIACKSLLDPVVGCVKHDAQGYSLLKNPHITSPYDLEEEEQSGIQNEIPEHPISEIHSNTSISRKQTADGAIDSPTTSNGSRRSVCRQGESADEKRRRERASTLESRVENGGLETQLENGSVTPEETSPANIEGAVTPDQGEQTPVDLHAADVPKVDASASAPSTPLCLNMPVSSPVPLLHTPVILADVETPPAALNPDHMDDATGNITVGKKEEIPAVTSPDDSASPVALTLNVNTTNAPSIEKNERDPSDLGENDSKSWDGIIGDTLLHSQLSTHSHDSQNKQEQPRVVEKCPVLSLCYLTTSYGSECTSCMYTIATQGQGQAITQYDLAYYVFLPILAENHRCQGTQLHNFHPRLLSLAAQGDVPGCDVRTTTPALVIPALLECIRALCRHKIKVEAILQHLVSFGLASLRSVTLLHRCLEAGVIPDGEYISDCLCALALESRPSATLARQCLLDMLYRRGEGARILHWHLLRGEVVGALRLVSHRSGLFNLPGLKPRDFLAAALATNDAVVFHTTFRFFENRNLELRGSPVFIYEDDCDHFVKAFASLFPPAGLIPM